MGDPWGIGGFKGGRASLILSISTKKSVKNSEKAANSEKIGKIGYSFFTEKGLKCIRNPTKHL